MKNFLKEQHLGIECKSQTANFKNKEIKFEILSMLNYGEKESNWAHRIDKGNSTKLKKMTMM